MKLYLYLGNNNILWLSTKYNGLYSHADLISDELSIDQNELIHMCKENNAKIKKEHGHFIFQFNNYNNFIKVKEILEPYIIMATLCE